MWATAAPARAASIAASAISSGRTGTRSLACAVSPAPVTAHVMNTSGFTDGSSRGRSREGDSDRRVKRGAKSVPARPGSVVLVVERVVAGGVAARARVAAADGAGALAAGAAGSAAGARARVTPGAGAAADRGPRSPRRFAQLAARREVRRAPAAELVLVLAFVFDHAARRSRRWRNPHPGVSGRTHARVAHCRHD